MHKTRAITYVNAPLKSTISHYERDAPMKKQAQQL